MKYLIWLVLTAAFTVAFDVATKGERRHYYTLLTVWKESSLPLARVESECRRVAAESHDAELRFVASYLGDLANLFTTFGYATVGRVSTSSKWEVFGRGFLTGYVNPGSALKTIPMWWNSDRFEREGKMLDERYGHVRYAPACLGLLASTIATFGVVAYWGKRRAGLALVPRPVAKEGIPVAPV